MLIQIDNMATITGCSQETFAEIKRRLTFPNPEYLEKKKRGFYTRNTPREIECYTRLPDSLSFPRSFTGQAIRIAKQNNESIQITDNRRTLPAVDFSFSGNLKNFQTFAVSDVLRKDFGVLVAPTGAGKTVVGLAVISARKQPALIICHTAELMHQWISRIQAFLGIPKEEIGIIGGGKMKLGAKITVALIQSLSKCSREVAPYIGHVIIDECHHTPSKTFQNTVSQFDCRYMLGLSATAYRRDGLSSV
jgi:superfamily II DNA or RNA helicase